MAKLVLRDATLEVDGVDISRWVFEVAVELGREDVEVTSLGAAKKEEVAGLGVSKITAAVYQDFVSASVDQKLWPLANSEIPFWVRVKPTSSPTSPTNPSYVMSALLPSYKPVASQIGEAATTDVVFVNASPAGLTRVDEEQLAYPDSPDAFPDLLYPG